VDSDEANMLMIKFDTVIRLLALSLVEGRKQVDQISLLSSAGLRPKEIADLLGTTPNTVSVALSHQRRASQKRALASRSPNRGQEEV
jgi:transcriptional regulator